MKNKGFTLIEVLVVAVIFSFVLAGIGLSFMSGMKIWQRARNADFPKANLLLTLEQIHGDLCQSVDFAQIGFEGDTYKFSFPEVTSNSVIRVTYEFDRDNKELLKKYVLFADILAKKEEALFIEKKVATLDDFSVEYLSFDDQAKIYSWQNAWAKDEGIFAAVRLKAKLNDEEFTRTVFIPAGS